MYHAVRTRRQALGGVKRPQEFEGENAVTVPAMRLSSSPNCTNDTSAPVLDRCFPLAALYVDFGMSGSDLQNPNGILRPNGYLVRACLPIARNAAVAASGPGSTCHLG